MEEFDRFNKKLRNIAFIIIILAIAILIIWIILFILSVGKQLQFILAIGIALFLSGILILTRIQYVIWINKRISKK